MFLSPGTRLGPYEILSAIGAGGMGEVYRARATTLGRDVALKILPEAFALDEERVARFTREAQILAALNHPHIAAIHDFQRFKCEAHILASSGQSNSATIPVFVGVPEVFALVMELVEGEDLSQRIALGPIPLDEALPIAKQIAEALEAAHEQGIIHRDLKPANIKVTLDGVVKVLDFGLAKLAHPEPAARHSDVTASPTITSPAMMTGAGMLLGTAAYMSPEQAKGREADKRSDIWAFGCVLYEMLTGKRPFDGEDVSDTLANVLKIDPDWSALPSDIPPAIRTLLQSCLTKDRRHRVADISTALFVLEKGASLTPLRSLDGAVSQAQADAAVSDVRRVLARSTRRRVTIAGAAALLAGTVVATTLTWFAMRPSDPAPPRVSRLQIASSGAAALTVGAVDRDLAITPDGSRVIYVGNRGTQLFVRALDALAPVAVFTGNSRGPFVSPDGQWIGFVVNGNVLKKMAVTGGPAVTLATIDTNNPRGATWGPDDTIIYATNNAATGLQRVGAAGGPTTVLTRPDHARGELDHLWPELLPGGRAVLFTITALTGGLDAAQVAVLDLQTGARKVLVRGGVHAHYVPSGHLVYAAAGTLRAVPFDLTRLETHGTPVPVVTDVVMTLAGGVDAVVSGDGTLAYVSGGEAEGQHTLVWVDRQGRETPIPAPPRVYAYPRLSPDGTRIAVSAQDQDQDLWVWDLGRTTLTRVTFDPTTDNYPMWTPDSRRLIFGSDRAGTRNLFGQAADGTGAVERLAESPITQNPTAVSPDGRRLIITETDPKTGDDVIAIELDGAHRVTPLVRSPFGERNGIVSPDGRWLAYEANDSGRIEIYVRPFPDVNSGHWQVSTSGGTRPLWARNGQELFFLSSTGAVMRVGVEHSQSWAATTPTQVVKEGYYTGQNAYPGRTYDIAPDGQQFLMMKEGSSDQTAAPASLIVVQHWTEELKRLVPSN